MGYNCENKANKKTDAKRFPVFFYIIIFKPRIVTTVYAVEFSFNLSFNFFVHFVLMFWAGVSPRPIVSCRWCQVHADYVSDFRSHPPLDFKLRARLGIDFWRGIS